MFYSEAMAKKCSKVKLDKFYIVFLETHQEMFSMNNQTWNNF